MNPVVPLLLSFFPWVGDPSALTDPPDTEAEVIRTCLPSQEALAAVTACDAELAWTRQVMDLEQNERYGTPDYYRWLEGRQACWEWRRDVYLAMYWADDPPVDRLGSLRRLRELVGPEVYRRGLSAMPTPPPAPPKPELGEGP